MKFIIPYAVENIRRSPDLADTSLDGEIGTRYDRFVYQRVNGKFAIEEILREAEDCIRDKYDDEFVHGLWKTEFWGKLMLSAVRVCRQKSDAQLKEDIRRSAYRLLSFQNPSGFLGSYADEENIFPASEEECIRYIGWASCYNWSAWGTKYTMWALLECAQLLDDEVILNACRRMADQLMGVLEKNGKRLKDAGVMHGMAAGSIMKPMLVLYRLTGEKKYYEFCLAAAREWEREDGEMPNLITNALSGKSPADWYEIEKDGKPNWYAKAYEMMSSYDGLIELYRVSGDGKYLQAVRAFWDSVKRDEENVLGSVGYCERFWHAKDYADSATEICDVLHWMRLSYELFCLTGEASYMEAFEKAFLNAFLAGVWEDGTSGAFFIRAAGRHWTADWQVETKYQHCCVNNVGRGYVNAIESVMTEGDDGYYVNLYLHSKIRFGEDSFRISRGYTDSGSVMITARTAQPGKKLYLRMPAWSKMTKIAVGETVTEAAPGAYYALTLAGGQQVIRLSFDMTPEVIHFAGTFEILPATDYHRYRWVDSSNGLCDVRQMLPSAKSVIRRGPVMLARSKRFGSTEEEMFSTETVWGKDCTCTARVIRHDRLLTGCRVTLTYDGQDHEYVMCDVASAANRDLEDVRFFSMYV